MSIEREVMLTGIGGQGVQLAAQVLARAAVREARQVMLFGSYGGTMRGGQTDSTLVVADGPLATPPIVSKLWAAVGLAAQRVFDVPATEIATEAGNPLAASMVLAGALAGVTGLLGPDSLVEAMRESLPAYRRQHAEVNERALRAGYASMPRGDCPAWTAEEDAA